MGSVVHATELEACVGATAAPLGSPLTRSRSSTGTRSPAPSAPRSARRSMPLFAGSIDLGDAADGVPNSACNAVYFSAPTGGVSWASLTP